MANIDKIKALAREKGIKIKYICSTLGLSETYLSNIKNGIDRMTDERLEKIADLLGTSPEYLNDQTDEKFPSSPAVKRNTVIIYDTNGKETEKKLSIAQIKALIAIIEQFD